MTQKEFNEVIKELDKMSKSIMLNKRPEYTNENEDVLQNFKSTAEELGISDLKVWAVFLMKHFQSVFTHVRNANLKKSEPIESRFADIINYCYLGLALFYERDGKKKNN